MKNTIIIGSGLAGYMLAKEYRKLNPEGPLSIITGDSGCFYSKPQLSTALTQGRNPTTLAMNSVEEMTKQLKAEIFSYNRVTQINPQEKTIYYQSLGSNVKKELSFDQLILAVGADKIPLKLEEPVSEDGLCSVNNLEDYSRFYQWIKNKSHIAIAGSGLVGCEFANDLANAGMKIEVVSLEKFPLAKFVPDLLGNRLAQQLEKNGVTWHFEKSIQAITSQEKKYLVTLSDGSQLMVDGVLSAIGIRPHIQLAQASNIRVNRGICVDPYLRTNHPNIFALGDCAEVEGQVKQYIAPLLQCAKSLAKILCGEEQPVIYPPMPVVVKTPAYPIVTLPPIGEEGQWEIQEEEKNMKALYFDAKGQLQGFCLTGDKIVEKNKLISSMSAK